MSNINNVNSAYDHFSKCFNEVAGKHASFKERNILPKQIERCAGGPKSKDFWPTIKPFLTNKGNVNQKYCFIRK